MLHLDQHPWQRARAGLSAVEASTRLKRLRKE
jgi:hypothetical protein